MFITFDSGRLDGLGGGKDEGDNIVVSRFLLLCVWNMDLNGHMGIWMGG
jgi:hypothetical protein